MKKASLEEGARARVKREQMLEGARRVFLREGFAAASTDALAQEAGVSKGTLYAYYPSKEQLFIGVMHRLLLDNPQTRVLDFVQELQPRDLREFRMALLSLGSKVLATLMQEETLALMRAIIADAHRFPQLTEVLRSTIPMRVATEVAALLKRARENGVAVRQGDTTLMTRLFIGPLLSYVVLDGLLSPQSKPQTPPAEQIEVLVDLFLNAISEEHDLEGRQ